MGWVVASSTIIGGLCQLALNFWFIRGIAQLEQRATRTEQRVVDLMLKVK